FVASAAFRQERSEDNGPFDWYLGKTSPDRFIFVSHSHAVPAWSRIAMNSQPVSTGLQNGRASKRPRIDRIFVIHALKGRRSAQTICCPEPPSTTPSFRHRRLRHRSI